MFQPPKKPSPETSYIEAGRGDVLLGCVVEIHLADVRDAADAAQREAGDVVGGHRCLEVGRQERVAAEDRQRGLRHAEGPARIVVLEDVGAPVQVLGEHGEDLSVTS